MMSCVDCPLYGAQNKRFKKVRDGKIVFAVPYLNQEVINLLNLLRHHVEKVSDEDFVVVPLLGCIIEEFNDDLLKKAYKSCKDRFLKDLNGSEVVLSFGEDVLKVFTREFALSKTLLQPFSWNGKKIIPLYNPIYLLTRKKLIDTVDKAVGMANALVNNKVLKLPNILEIKSENDFEDAYVRLKSEELVGVDIETTHNQIFRNDFHIISIAFALDDVIYYINLKNSLRKLQYAIHLLSAIKTPIFHNFLFDGVAIKKELGVCFTDFEDTMIMAYLIDENRQKSLKFLASIYLNAIYDITAKEFLSQGNEMSEMDEDTLRVYNAMDSYVTLQLYHKLKEDLDENLYRFYTKFMKKFTWVLFEMIYNGFPVDVNEVLKLKEYYQNREKEILKEINSLEVLRKARRIVTALENGLVDKEAFMTDPSVIEKINLPSLESDLVLSKNSHILAILYTLKKVPQKKTASGKVALNEMALKDIDDEVVNLILEYREVKKMHSTYLDRYVDEYIAPDGRVHAAYSLVGTVTGRTSSSNPNLQNIPRNSIIKNIFYAPDGYKLLQYDWSQIELRIAAALSGETKMIEAYKSKVDLHRLTASKLFDKPMEEVTDEERQLAKGCSFGVLYGISPKGLSENFKIPVEKAKKLIEGFFREYPRLRAWQTKIKENALKTGIVTTPVGRVRRLYGIYSSIPSEREEALRQAVNSPVQSLASDINLMLLYLFLKEDFKDAELVCSVHDSGVFLVKEGKEKELAQLLLRLVDEKISRLPFLNGVPMEIEISVGKRWGEMEELEL